LPTTYTWARLGVRKVVDHQAPQGRRVNVTGAFAPFDPAGARFLFECRGKADGPLDAKAHLGFVAKVAGLQQVVETKKPLQRPCVIVLDNYSVHHSQPIKDMEDTLKAAGVTFFYLPPYSPEMNRIEPVWKQVKHQDMDQRSYTSEAELKHAVLQALNKRAAIIANSYNFLTETA